jgi:hypothetical protein
LDWDDGKNLAGIMTGWDSNAVAKRKRIYFSRNVHLSDQAQNSRTRIFKGMANDSPAPWVEDPMATVRRNVNLLA